MSDGDWVQIRDLAIELREARAEAARLREALLRYGQHEDGCPAWPSFPSHFAGASNVGECACGLRAALAAKGEDKQ